MEGDDIRSVMKWVGYVYIPIIIIFVAVYCLVQYRLRTIEQQSHSAPLSATTERIESPTVPDVLP